MPPLPEALWDPSLTAAEAEWILLDRWLMSNRQEAVADLVKAAIFKVASLILLVTMFYSTPARSGTMLMATAVCLLLDWAYRPGSLYSIHRHAASEIANLKTKMMDRLAARRSADEEPDTEKQAEVVKELWKEMQQLAYFIREAEVSQPSAMLLWKWRGTKTPKITEREWRSLSDAGLGRVVGPPTLVEFEKRLQDAASLERIRDAVTAMSEDLLKRIGH